MRLRNLLVALVIAAGLGGAVWYALKHPPGSGAKATPDTSVKVVNIPEDQIRQRRRVDRLNFGQRPIVS